MRILFDNGTPAPLVRYLSHHEVVLAKDAGWERLVNGQLLAAAEQNGFDLLLTTDKNIRYQQNLSGRRIALVVLGLQNWPIIRPHAARIVAAVDTCVTGAYIEVEIPYPPRLPVE
jgi:hypothetical protein